jgi:hypothetical protein
VRPACRTRRILVSGTRQDDGPIKLGTRGESRLTPFEAASERWDTQIAWGHISQRRCSAGLSSATKRLEGRPASQRREAEAERILTLTLRDASAHGDHAPGAPMAESGPDGSAPEGAAYLCSAADMHQLTRRQPGARIEAKAIARPPSWP